MAIDNDEPAPARRRLGLELRNLRRQAGLNGEQAAAAVQTSKSRISRLENGKLRKFRDYEIRALLETYGFDDKRTRDRFVALAARARQGIWVDDYEDVLPAKFESYVGIELEAARIRAYDDQLIHGLFQTPDYARALLHAVTPTNGQDTIDRLVELRLRRQLLLDREPSPVLWMIMDEVVIRRPVGGGQVMAAQLQHLLDLSQRSFVTMQVLPYAEGAHAGLDGPFSILEFDEPDATDVVYVNSAAGNHYPKNITMFNDRFDLLRAVALSPDRSAAFIESVKKEMTT